MNHPTAVAGLALLLATPAAAQTAGAPTLPTAPPRPWSVAASMTSATDSNINHDESRLSAYGMVAGAAFRYTMPAWQAEYQTGVHRYTGTDRWDRLSHRFWGVREWDLHGPWSADLQGEVSLKGSTEDRELSNQYVLQPRVRYRLDDRRRIRAYAAGRLKRYEDDRDRDASNFYLGSELNYRAEHGDQWDLGGRYEINRAIGPRFDYGRWTFYVQYETPIGKRDRLNLELKYRQKRYPDRLIEVDDVDVPRRDLQWLPSVSWVRAWSSHVALRLGYDFETRGSNDPDKDFSAHLLTVSLTRRW